MNELAPCPFCKSSEVSAYETWYEDAERASFHVACDDCGARGPMNESKDGSIMCWNTRWSADRAIAESAERTLDDAYDAALRELHPE